MEISMKAHDFEVHGGSKVVDDRSHWPDSLNLSMDDFYAWEMVHSLLAQLKRKWIDGCNDQNDKDIKYSFCGKLDYDIDEDA